MIQRRTAGSKLLSAGLLALTAGTETGCAKPVQVFEFAAVVDILLAPLAYLLGLLSS